MNTLNTNIYALKNLNKINIILGKNGCGKSSLLRNINDISTSDDKDSMSLIRYITPERGGVLFYEPNVEQNILRSNGWLKQTRLKNQFDKFREQTMSQYKLLELNILRAYQEDSSRPKFDSYIEKINSLLDNIYIKPSKTTFEIFSRNTGLAITPEQISSGESELISLAIECLAFCKECNQDRENILLLDEPDVHLHPDLQARLMLFLTNLIENHNFIIILATHSTAILGALGSYENTSIAFMQHGQVELNFELISPMYQKIIPVFGAHPLSSLFNQSPIFLLEGEDDVRIWQQAIRSSINRIKIYPVSCDGVSEIPKYEKETSKIISALYENAKAYSLRDKDNKPDNNITDTPPFIKFKLNCHSSENLLLTDEVLASLDTTWDNLKSKMDDWISSQTNHLRYEAMKQFKDKGYDRQNYNLKDIRNILMYIIDSLKPWEVTIGQTIGTLQYNDSIDFDKEGSIYNYLGKKLVENIII